MRLPDRALPHGRRRARRVDVHRRAELDELDARSLAFLARRRELVREVVRAKSADGKAVRDPLREEALLERLISLGREQGLDAHFVTKVFGEIIAECRVAAFVMAAKTE